LWDRKDGRGILVCGKGRGEGKDSGTEGWQGITVGREGREG